MLKMPDRPAKKSKVRASFEDEDQEYNDEPSNYEDTWIPEDQKQVEKQEFYASIKEQTQNDGKSGLMAQKKARDKIKSDEMEEKLKESLQNYKLKFDFAGIPADNLIMKYVNHQAKNTSAYAEYHFAGAIFIISTLTDRRVSAKFAQTTIYQAVTEPKISFL